MIEFLEVLGPGSGLGDQLNFRILFLESVHGFLHVGLVGYPGEKPIGKLDFAIVIFPGAGN